MKSVYVVPAWYLHSQDIVSAVPPTLPGKLTTITVQLTVAQATVALASCKLQLHLPGLQEVKVPVQPSLQPWRTRRLLLFSRPTLELYSTPAGCNPYAWVGGWIAAAISYSTPWTTPVVLYASPHLLVGAAGGRWYCWRRCGWRGGARKQNGCGNSSAAGST